MPKKITALSDYITAHDAALLLSEKLGRPISAKYIRRLAKVKKHPIRIEQKGDRILYHRQDVEAATIRQREARQN